MKINIETIINDKLDLNNVNIKIEVANRECNISDLMQHIQNFENLEIVVRTENEIRTIKINDILYFYSDKKYNYCKTEKEIFKIRSKLYELEKINSDFLRISKSCVINIQNVKSFDLGETGRIIVKFYDDSVQPVSRRKIRDVMNYLEERGI